ncbi:MAG: galactose-1-phosphate uridylyltransferase [Deltaproteobacteria bacterium]|nr:galactose-1-phosphate uridylyltransferase [Deltaproteobacteria bacterium]
MSELRKDLITREWVIMSPERARRPSDFQHEQAAQAVITKNHSVCPFCPGNESMTPSEILAFRKKGAKPDSSDWWVRVVPNRFPALMIEGKPNRSEHLIYDRMDGIGAHEVIVETREHGKPLSRLDERQMKEVWWMYKERYTDLCKDSRLKYILIFKNHGKVAGASIEHSHSQLIATPMIPQQVWLKIKGIEQYFDYRDTCAYCDMVRAESGQENRTAAENESFIAIEPYAARHPFETWIIPKRHSHSFIDTKESERDDLTGILKEVLLKLELCLNDPPYNYAIINAPINSGVIGQFHWHLEIIPRLTIAAGFELGTGIYINPVPPEESAKYLREIKTIV